MEEYQGTVIRVADNKITDNIPFLVGEEAENAFLRMCKQCLSNFDEYNIPKKILMLF